MPEGVRARNFARPVQSTLLPTFGNVIDAMEGGAPWEEHRPGRDNRYDAAIAACIETAA